MIKRRVIWAVLLLFLGIGLGGCGDRPNASLQPSSRSPFTQNRRIAEVAPPAILQELRPTLDSYQPQVEILSPRPGVVIDDDRVTVKFQVRDLPIFKDEDLGLGPYLQVYLDDQPYQAVYDANQTLIFQGLMPGTHTIRAIAARPWHETYKNEGAFDTVTFHSFTKTPKNNPDPARPLLTYSRPQSSIGAEPVMLDFYLTNAPLHLIAQENREDDIKDWRIRCTVNGESFIFDEWRPIYLTGLKPGKNWVQLELLDEDGLPTDNAFNNTARLILYEPNGTDTLARLVRGDLPLQEALAITDPNYVPAPPVVAPTPEEPPAPLPEPTPEPEEKIPQPPVKEMPPEILAPASEPEEVPVEEPADAIEEPTPEPELFPESEESPLLGPEASPNPEAGTPDLETDQAPADKALETEQLPSADETAPEDAPAPTPLPRPTPPEEESLPRVEAIPEVPGEEIETDLEENRGDIPPSFPDTEEDGATSSPDAPPPPKPVDEQPSSTQRLKSRFQQMRSRLKETLQKPEAKRSPAPAPDQATPPSPEPPPRMEEPAAPPPDITPDMPVNPDPVLPEPSDPLNLDDTLSNPPTPPSPLPIGGTPWV